MKCNCVCSIVVEVLPKDFESWPRSWTLLWSRTLRNMPQNGWKWTIRWVVFASKCPGTIRAMKHSCSAVYLSVRLIGSEPMVLLYMIDGKNIFIENLLSWYIYLFIFVRDGINSVADYNSSRGWKMMSVCALFQTFHDGITFAIYFECKTTLEPKPTWLSNYYSS